MDCRVCAATGDVWFRMGNGGGGGVGEVGQIGGFSHESEHDLAVMVRDFLEVGSSGNDSRYSSDSDSGFCDLVRLADHISYYKLSADQYESDLLSVVNSLLQSIKATDLHLVKSGTCNASCVRFSLVKLLRLSGYDAAVCASKWQGSGKVPGGDHEYIDVINHKYNGSSERLIIDIDFRSHFEIARAVESYDRILNSLPVIYVGSLAKLKWFLQAMVEAASSSLKQNSMPLPPWRSLSYLQAKWHSPYQRRFNPDEQTSVLPSEPKQCIRLLKSMQSSLRSEIEVERLFKPINSENNRRLKLERWRHSLIRTL
ncbi:cruciferin [Actinidia rufa]|uniref:Cruciferin n=1 Tax=Actinidia rufa TaxID=165716 RepID=A0A7J0GVN5_9ERIC|nr:cruciferin [Actinidia rufa]